MLNLRSFTRAYHEDLKSYAELLPWFGMGSPELVLNLDGSLLAGFEFEGVQVESSDDDQANLAGEAMEIGLRAFDDRNCLWSFFDKRRKGYAPEPAGNNPVARAVMERWNEHVDDGNLRYVRHVLFLSYQPFGGKGGYFEEVAVRGLSQDESYIKSMLAVFVERLAHKTQLQRLEGKIGNAIKAFEAQLDAFSAALGARVRIKRFDGDTLRAELSNRANLATLRQGVRLPNGPYYLNTLLPTDTVLRLPGGYLAFEGAIDKKVVSVYSVKGYGGEAKNEVVEQLLKSPADFTVCHLFQFLDKQKAEALISSAEAHYTESIKTPIVRAMEKITGQESDRVNLGMQVLASDAQDALIEMTAENVGYGYHSMVFQVIADSVEENEKNASLVVRPFINDHYGVVRENVNMISAFATTIPGAQDKVTRTSLFSTRNLADLTVLRTISAGSAENKHLTSQRQVYSGPLALLSTTSDIPEYFHLHVGDVGHFRIIGPAGAGKTTLVNFLLMQWQQYSPCKTIVLDKDFSNYITITALGGQYVDLRPGHGGAKMNPGRWAVANDEVACGKLRRWLEVALLAFDKTPLSAADIKVIDRSINILANQGGEHSLLALWQILKGQDIGDSPLSLRLQPWIRGNRYGYMFDHAEDTFSLSDISGIEVGGLLQDDHLAAALLGYLFEVVDEKVDATMPTFIYLEEAWYLLREAIFRARFEDWIRTMRKRNAVVGIATQTIKEMRDVPISAALNDNIKTSFYLPNEKAGASIDVYTEMCGLSVEDVGIIRSAHQKGQYYLAQDSRRRLLEVVLPPDILALTRSDARAKEVFARHKASGRDNWIQTYVMEMV